MRGNSGGEWKELRMQRGPGRTCKALWAMGKTQALFSLRKVGAMEGSRQRDVPSLADQDGFQERTAANGHWGMAALLQTPW